MLRDLIYRSKQKQELYETCVRARNERIENKQGGKHLAAAAAMLLTITIASAASAVTVSVTASIAAAVSALLLVGCALRRVRRVQL